MNRKDTGDIFQLELLLLNSTQCASLGNYSKEEENLFPESNLIKMILSLEREGANKRVKVLGHSANSHLKGFYYYCLKSIYDDRNEPLLHCLKQHLYPPECDLSQVTNIPAPYNDLDGNQMKKLIVQFFHVVSYSSERNRVENYLNKYSVVEVILVVFLRTVLQKHGVANALDYSKPISWADSLRVFQEQFHMPIHLSSDLGVCELGSSFWIFYDQPNYYAVYFESTIKMQRINLDDMEFESISVSLTSERDKDTHNNDKSDESTPKFRMYIDSAHARKRRRSHKNSFGGDVEIKSYKGKIKHIFLCSYLSLRTSLELSSSTIFPKQSNFDDIVKKKNASEFGEKDSLKNRRKEQREVRHVDNTSKDSNKNIPKKLQQLVTQQTHNLQHRPKKSSGEMQSDKLQKSEDSFNRRRTGRTNPRVERNPAGRRFEASNQKVKIDIDDDTPVTPASQAVPASPRPSQKEQSVKSSRFKNHAMVFTWDERSSFSQLAGLKINEKIAEQVRIELQKHKLQEQGKREAEAHKVDNQPQSSSETNPMKKSNAKIEQLNNMKNSGAASFGSTLIEQSQRSSTKEEVTATNNQFNSLLGLRNLPSLQQVNRMNPNELNALSSNMSRAELQYISKITEEMTSNQIIEMLSPTVRESLKLRKYSMQTDFMKKPGSYHSSNVNSTQKSESPDSTSSPRHSNERNIYHKNSFIQSEALFRKVAQNSNRFGTYFAAPAPSMSLSVVGQRQRSLVDAPVSPNSAEAYRNAAVFTNVPPSSSTSFSKSNNLKVLTAQPSSQQHLLAKMSQLPSKKDIINEFNDLLGDNSSDQNIGSGGKIQGSSGSSQNLGSFSTSMPSFDSLNSFIPPENKTTVQRRVNYQIQFKYNNEAARSGHGLPPPQHVGSPHTMHALPTLAIQHQQTYLPNQMQQHPNSHQNTFMQIQQQQQPPLQPGHYVHQAMLARTNPNAPNNRAGPSRTYVTAIPPIRNLSPTNLSTSSNQLSRTHSFIQAEPGQVVSHSVMTFNQPEYMTVKPSSANIFQHEDPRNWNSNARVLGAAQPQLNMRGAANPTLSHSRQRIYTTHEGLKMIPPNRVVTLNQSNFIRKKGMVGQISVKRY